MFHERWSSPTEQEIKLPQNNKTAVKHFLKYLYTDIIPFEDVEIADILEILQLAHLYQVHKLLGQCKGHLTANINEKNWLQIHRSCKLVVKGLSNKALQFFLANVIPIAKSNDAYLTWDYVTVKTILRKDRVHAPESVLFNALLRWRNVDIARNEGFKKLLKLIRFPTMNAKNFADDVVPSGVLSKDEIVEVFSYIATQNGSIKFPTEPRQSLVSARTNDDPKPLKICGSPGPVSLIPLDEMVQPQRGNFHKFRLEIRNQIQHRSRFNFFRNKITPDIKLFGVKLFSGCVNYATLISHLRSKSFTIRVQALCENDELHTATSELIVKTITQLQQIRMQAYFDSPLNISQNNICVITTNFTMATGSRATSYRKYIGSARLPELGSPSHQLSFNSPTRPKLIIDIERLKGSYSLIDELLFYPPHVPENHDDCNIS